MSNQMVYPWQFDGAENFTIDVGRESERTVRSPKDSERSGITLQVLLNVCPDC